MESSPEEFADALADFFDMIGEGIAPGPTPTSAAAAAPAGGSCEQEGLDDESEEGARTREEEELLNARPPGGGAFGVAASGLPRESDVLQL